MQQDWKALGNYGTLGMEIALSVVVGLFGGGLLFGLGHYAAMTLTGAGLAGAGAACLVIIVPSVVFVHQPEAPTQALAVLNTFPMLSARNGGRPHAISNARQPSA